MKAKVQIIKAQPYSITDKETGQVKEGISYVGVITASCFDNPMQTKVQSQMILKAGSFYQADLFFMTNNFGKIEAQVVNLELPPAQKAA